MKCNSRVKLDTTTTRGTRLDLFRPWHSPFLLSLAETWDSYLLSAAENWRNPSLVSPAETWRSPFLLSLLPPLRGVDVLPLSLLWGVVPGLLGELLHLPRFRTKAETSASTQDTVPHHLGTFMRWTDNSQMLQHYKNTTLECTEKGAAYLLREFDF